MFHTLHTHACTYICLFMAMEYYEVISNLAYYFKLAEECCTMPSLSLLITPPYLKLLSVFISCSNYYIKTTTHTKCWVYWSYERVFHWPSHTTHCSMYCTSWTHAFSLCLCVLFPHAVWNCYFLSIYTCLCIHFPLLACAQTAITIYTRALDFYRLMYIDSLTRLTLFLLDGCLFWCTDWVLLINTINLHGTARNRRLLKPT